MSGKGQYTNGNWIDFKLTNLNVIDTAKNPSPKKEVVDYGKTYYPFGAYGEAEATAGLIKDTWSKFKKTYDGVLIKNATIWTNEKDSILKDQDVYMVEWKNCTHWPKY